MRRHLIPIIIFFSLISGIIVFLLNSNWFLLDSLPHTLAGYVKPFQFQSLRVGKSRYKLPGTLVLSDVHFSLQQPLVQIDFSMREVTVFNLLDIVKKPRKVRVDIKGLSMDGRQMKLNNVNLQLLFLANENTVPRAEGVFFGESVFFDFYHTDQIKGRINVDRQKIELLDIVAKAYGGDVKGQLLIDRGAMHSYIIWAELSHLKSERLKEINESLFTQITGEFNGTFRMKNDGQDIEFITAEMSFDKGGQIKAPFIKKISSHAVSLNKTSPEETITQGKESISFDQGHFYVQNTGQAKVMAGAELKNTKDNLDIRALQEIPTLSGIDEFMLGGIRTNIFAKGE